MWFQLIMAVVVVGLFLAALAWGEDSRVGFSDPRAREGSLLTRRGELR